MLCLQREAIGKVGTMTHGPNKRWCDVVVAGHEGVFKIRTTSLQVLTAPDGGPLQPVSEGTAISTSFQSIEDAVSPVAVAQPFPAPAGTPAEQARLVKPLLRARFCGLMCCTTSYHLLINYKL